MGNRLRINNYEHILCMRNLDIYLEPPYIRDLFRYLESSRDNILKYMLP